jgi:Phosphodiester glycosidase
MLRRAIIFAAIIAAVAGASPSSAARVRGQTLTPGVVYSRQVEFTTHGPVALNVVAAPRPGGLYSLRVGLSNGFVQGRERLTDLQKAMSGSSTVVGINGDFFNTSWGTPSSVLIRGGVLGAGGGGGRSAAGFDGKGGLHVDRVSLDGSWKGKGQYRPLVLNRPPASGTTLYTPAWGPATPGEVQGAVAVTLRPFPAAVPNTTLTAPVVGVAQGGSQPIPPDGAVLVARGSQVAPLTAEAPAGSSVSVRLILTPPWSDVVEAVGGGPVLVRAGRPIFRADETFAASQLITRTARGAVGQTADGRILLVTVDGRRPGYSTGMSNFELALAMARLGAVNACGLGTGSAAALAFDGKLLSRPAGGGEIPIADALLIGYDGVYVPAPAAEAAVGKPLTLAYKVVRTSFVTVTLTGPDGAATTLESAARAPGTYRIDWNAAAAGSWKLSVAADDDLGRHSTAERAFTVGRSSR